MGRGRRWTQAEIELLEDRWGSGTMIGLAKNLGRTKAAIVNKAWDLGLGAWSDASEYISASALGNALDITEYHVQNGRPKRTCKYCCNARSKAYRDKDRAKGKKRINTKYGDSREMVSVPPWPPSVRVGAKITVELDVDLREREAESAIFSGVVVYLDSRKATIKGKHFRKTLERVDIHTHHVRVLG